MNIHEYQAKAVLREFGVPLAKGVAVFSAKEAEKAARIVMSFMRHLPTEGGRLRRSGDQGD